MRKVKYLNNRDLLKQIHKSKNSFSSYVDDEYAQYDIILPSLDKVNRLTVAEASVIVQIALASKHMRPHVGQVTKRQN